MDKLTFTAAELETAEILQLIAFFNQNSETQIARFADRKSAVRRCLPFVSDAAPAAPVAEPVAEPKAVKEPKAPKAPEPAAEPKDRSAAVAASWADPATAAKRKERTNVKVDGQMYRSVLEAYQDLGLPVSTHINFRAKLKAAGKLTDGEGRKWEAVPVVKTPKEPKAVKEPKAAKVPVAA